MLPNLENVNKEKNSIRDTKEWKLIYKKYASQKNKFKADTIEEQEELFRKKIDSITEQFLNKQKEEKISKTEQSSKEKDYESSDDEPEIRKTERWKFYYTKNIDALGDMRGGKKSKEEQYKRWIDKLAGEPVDQYNIMDSFDDFTQGKEN